MTEEPHSSTHPPLPPTTEDDRISWLRLLRSRRVGPTTFYRLLGEHGTAQNALEALPDVARAAGVENYETCSEAVVVAELKAARAAGARLLCRGGPEYPPELAQIEDAPPLLWAIGDTGLCARRRIALVGARNASSLGTRMARALAHDLGRAGFVIVSGLARGVDTAAHLAALEQGTIAVMAGGADIIYPAENTGLAESIARQGLRLSEEAMGQQPFARHFPRRNRLISGMSEAVIVVEAASKSGSLITARDALDQGRDVLAVPGHPFDGRAAGGNLLIRDGATLVRNAQDVLDALTRPVASAGARQPARDLAVPQPGNTQPGNTQRRTLRETAELHRQILERLGPSPVAEDQLIRDLDHPARTVSPAIVDLELEGRVRRQPGGLLSRVV